MKLYPLIVFLLAIYPTCILAQPVDDASPIDQKLIRKVDVTGDGKPDKIVLHLTAKNIKAPFKWTLSIISEGKQIYTYSSDDTSINNNFEDAKYTLGCDDYLSCKKKYYYHSLLDHLVLTGNKRYSLEGILDKNQSYTLYGLGRKQLKECCNITGAQADAILGRIEAKFRTGKVVALVVPKSPVHVNPPLVFVPEVGRFIIFYQE
jgi:hypothetical protein